ncbi:MAG: histidine kinase [Bacteroidota bacterium]
MKTLFNCLLFCLLCKLGFAQEKKFAVVDQDGRPTIYNVSSLKSKITLSLSVDPFTRSIKPFDQLQNDELGTIVYLEDAKKALLTVLLRKDSLSYYRYSVVENDTVSLVKDAVPKKVNFVWNERSSFPGYLTMDLGLENIVDKKITVKIYRLPDAANVTTLIIYNRPLRPAKVVDVSTISAPTPPHVKKEITPLKDGVEIDLNPKTTGLFLSIKKSDLIFAYRVFVMRLTGEADRNMEFAAFPVAWQYNSIDGNPYCVLDANYFNKAGQYKIYVLPQIGRELDVSAINAATPQFSFRIKEMPKAYSTKELLLISAAILVSVSLIATLIIFFIKRRSRNKIQAAQKKAESTKGQLDQIRSQLNPHFVYNSLSGIQNLMNQNEVESANAYLSKFARLTRNILNEQDRISIQDERSLLDDYLAMERLRFGFSYELKTDADTDLLHVEIPAMLLQPFVENACKHAMSVLGEKGLLGVAFKSAGKDLILKITDNGKGFDLHQEHEGLGLKLCRKRIDLLNQLYTECPVSLDINSGHSGTVVTITLKNWL